MSELIIEGLSKSFGAADVLSQINLRVAAGDFLAVLGASGSGKTTLLRLIAGFERADAGAIRLAGQQVEGPSLHVPPERRKIGYVPQEGALFPHLSVADNISFGLPRSERRSPHRVAELLSMLGLPADFASRGPHQLSGGEQQRVALARALAPRPALILLDEPFSALDTALRAETRAAVAAALAAAGATAILVTHDQPEALSMGTQVAVLRTGRLIQAGSPRDLYAHPADAALARFLGEAVSMRGTAGDGHVRCHLGSLRLAAGMPEGAVDVLIRPEQIRIAATQIHGAIPARVETVTFYGHDASIGLSLEDHPEIRITSRVAGYLAPRIRDQVWITIEGDVVAYPGS